MSARAIAGGIFAVVIIAFVGTTKVRGGTPDAGPATREKTTSFGGRVAVPIIPASAPALAMPVSGIDPGRIADTWGDPRDNGLRVHHGTDITAPAGTKVIAAAPGLVEKLHQSSAGGITLYVRSPDRQWSYYYAHLSGYAPGVYEGAAVGVGDPIGYVGDTGNAGAGSYHLHFGLSRMAAGDRWWQGTPIDPYPMLAARRGRSQKNTFKGCAGFAIGNGTWGRCT